MPLFNDSGHLLPPHLFREQLRMGADPNAVWVSAPGTHYTLTTPLLSAARRGIPVYLQALLADPRTDLMVADLEGRQALHLACAHGYYRNVAALLAHGANVHGRDTYGCVPLHYACHAIDDQSLRLLLDAGSDPNARNEAGRAPLHETLMAYTTFPKPLEDKVALLLKHGANVNQRGALGMTPLYMAACAGWARLTAMLLQAGADPSLRAENGERPVDAVLRQLEMGSRKDPDLRATYTALVAHDRAGLLAVVAQVGPRIAAVQRAL